LATNRKTEYLARMVHWPTVCASEVRQGFQDRSRGMKGSQESLTTAVVKDVANWLTPQSGDVTGSTREAVVMWANGQRPKTSDQRLRTQVAAEQLKHGQAAPASSNSLGSRQGLWLTPRANEPTGDSTFVTRNGDRGQHCSPSLTIQVEKSAQWGTPAANDANKQNVMCEVNSKQAGLPKSVGLELQRQWATPRNCGGPDYAKATRPTSMSNSPSLPTQVAMQGWITPKASDGKSPGISRDLHLNHQAGGKLNSQWVTQLMGLNLGWVSPSCPASVIKNWPRFVSGWSALTIAPMSCDFSAMESCLPPRSELSEFSLAS
jgi:hypothetical protein